MPNPENTPSTKINITQNIYKTELYTTLKISRKKVKHKMYTKAHTQTQNYTQHKLYAKYKTNTDTEICQTQAICQTHTNTQTFTKKNTK